MKMSRLPKLFAVIGAVLAALAVAEVFFALGSFGPEGTSIGRPYGAAFAHHIVLVAIAGVGLAALWVFVIRQIVDRL